MSHEFFSRSLHVNLQPLSLYHLNDKREHYPSETLNQTWCITLIIETCWCMLYTIYKGQMTMDNSSYSFCLLKQHAYADYGFSPFLHTGSKARMLSSSDLYAPPPMVLSEGPIIKHVCSTRKKKKAGLSFDSTSTCPKWTRTCCGA